MTGRVTAVHPTYAEMVSETSKACDYTFERDRFFGDWEALAADVASGATVRVFFQGSLGVAKRVQRISA